MPRSLSSAEIAEACTLLSDQATALVAGLRSLEPAEQERALSAHEAGRDAWVRLLDAVDAMGGSGAPGAEDLADRLGALHATHGRLAALLARGLDGWFSLAAAREVRTVLGDQLAADTTATVAALRNLAAVPAAGGDGVMAGAAA